MQGFSDHNKLIHKTFCITCIHTIKLLLIVCILEVFLFWSANKPFLHFIAQLSWFALLGQLTVKHDRHYFTEEICTYIKDSLYKSSLIYWSVFKRPFILHDVIAFMQINLIWIERTYIKRHGVVLQYTASTSYLRQVHTDTDEEGLETD